MSVLVDTPIWSAALRKRPSPGSESLIAELKRLLYVGEAVLTGLIRLEILSGVPPHAEFKRIRDELRKVADLPAQTEDYETAAEVFTLCRSKGVQGSHADFLLCALSLRHNLPIFTTDNDFTLYARHIQIALHKPSI